MMQQFPSAVLEATRETGSTPSTRASGTNTPALDLAALETQLTTLGFRPAHVNSALSALQSASERLNSSSSATSDPLVLSLTILSPLEAAIEWLLLHLPEDDLPHRYRTTASSSDFVTGASKQGGLVRGWLVDKLVKQAGFPRKAVDTVLSVADIRESAALEILSRKLCGWEGDGDGWGTSAVLDASETPDHEERDLAREEEIMAVEAVMGERYRKLSETELAIDIEDPSSGDKLVLHILFDNASPYPSSQFPTRPPAYFLESPDLPAYMRLHIHAAMMKQFRDPERGDLRSILEAGQGGAVLSMVEYLEQILPETIASPPDIGSVTDHLVPRPAVEEVKKDTGLIRKAVKKASERTYRRKQVTERDHEAASEVQKRMMSDSKWPAMLRDREKLPAWKEKDSIVNALEKNRVLVVVGETGCGKST